MTALVGLLLNKGAAQCDRNAIYVEGKPLALRPIDLPDSDWNAVCRFVCNEPPVVDWLEFTPTPDDPSVWTRLDTYMATQPYNGRDDYPSRSRLYRK